MIIAPGVENSAQNCEISSLGSLHDHNCNDVKIKLRCTLTGHELPARGNQLDEYTKSKKFVRAWRIHKIMEEYSDCFDDVGYECLIVRLL